MFRHKPNRLSPIPRLIDFIGRQINIPRCSYVRSMSFVTNYVGDYSEIHHREVIGASVPTISKILLKSRV
jgi:hypothetical protein